MGLIAKVAQIDKKFGWSFLGFVLAAVFGGIAIYTEFVRDTSPLIKYEILSNTKILDVKEDVSGLSIIYNSEDIRKARKTLSVLIVRIGNEGRSPILKSYYDSASPLGLSIGSGEVIKAEIIAATTDYLRKNAAIRLLDESNVEFSPIIVEPNESFTAKFLILNPEQSTVSISPKGKVAGVRSLLLADRTLGQTRETFLSKAVSGSIWIQIVRIPTYVVAFILLLIITIAPVVYVSDRKDQMNKNRIVRKYKSHVADSSVNKSNEELYEFYKHHGLTILRNMMKVLSDDKKFQNLLKKYESLASEVDGIPESVEFISVAGGGVSQYHRMAASPVFLVNSMLKLGLISKMGEDYARNDTKMESMRAFIQFAATKKT